MDIMEYLAPVGMALLFRSPVIIAWIIGVILAARMLRRDGGKSERLLLIGCGLMLAVQLISPFTGALTRWYIVENRGDIGAQSIALFTSLTNLPFAIISLAGIVCLVYAFWTRWKSHRQQPEAVDQAVVD